MKAIWRVSVVGTVALLILGVLPSCKTVQVAADADELVLRVLPEGEWRTAKVYIDDQYLDMAVYGGGQKDLEIEPGEHRIRVVTDNHEPWEETVTVACGGGKQYIQLHPERLVQ